MAVQQLLHCNDGVGTNKGRQQCKLCSECKYLATCSENTCTGFTQTLSLSISTPGKQLILFSCFTGEVSRAWRGWIVGGRAIQEPGLWLQLSSALCFFTNVSLQTGLVTHETLQGHWLKRLRAWTLTLAPTY